MESKTYPLYRVSDFHYEVVTRVPFVTEALICYQGRYFVYYPDHQWGKLGAPEEAGYIEEEVFRWSGQKVASPTKQVLEMLEKNTID